MISYIYHTRSTLPTEKNIIYISGSTFPTEIKQNFQFENLTPIENTASFYSTLFQYGSILPTEKNVFLVEKLGPNWK